MSERQIVVVDNACGEDWWTGADWSADSATVKTYRDGAPRREGSRPSSAEAVYLQHIIENYDKLPEQIVFLHGGAAEHCPDIVQKVRCTPVDVGFKSYGEELLVEEVDESSDPLFDELPLGTDGGAAPSFVSYQVGSLFAVSRKQIRAHPLSWYRRAAGIAESGVCCARSLQRYWHRLFAVRQRRRGIVTAADSHIYRDLQFLIQSLQAVDKHPIIVYDLGLKHYQLEWCLSQPNVTCRPLPPLSPSLRQYVGQHRWQAWLKPAYIRDADLDEMAWIDADCVVVEPLTDFFAMLEEAPLLMPEVAPGCGANHADLYTKHLPIANADERISTEINNGVIGLHRNRDHDLLDAWLYAVEWAVENPQLRHLIRWYDQGAFLWAILKTGNERNILSSQRWNYPAQIHRPLLSHAIENRISLVETMRLMHPAASIVHWFGLCKLSIAFNEEINRLFEFEPAHETLERLSP